MTMFGLFKRTRVEDWEVEMLKSVFVELGKKYEQYVVQIESGLLKGVLMGIGDIPNYVGFSYNPPVYEEFYDRNGKNFRLSNVKLMDSSSNKWMSISLFFAYGVVSGYSVDSGVLKRRTNISKIDVESVEKKYIGGSDASEVLSLLSSEELELINENDIYISFLEGEEFYHLKELEDGNFIGINKSNKVYQISHDPFEIQLLERSRLIDFLK